MRDEDQVSRAIWDIQRGVHTESAASWLYEEYYPYVMRLFGRFGFRREDAEDLTQDTFVRIFNGISGFRMESNFVTWLNRIVQGVVANEIRRRSAAKRETSRERVFSSLPEEELLDVANFADPSQNPEAQAVLGEVLRIAEAAMPPRMRQCFMRTLLGYRMNEIAKELELSIGTVKTQLYRARQILESMDLPSGTRME